MSDSIDFDGVDDVQSMDIPTDLVDRIRSILSGETQKPENAEKISTKIDGRTKEFKDTLPRKPFKFYKKEWM